jgi:hypothetical protein
MTFKVGEISPALPYNSFGVDAVRRHVGGVIPAHNFNQALVDFGVILKPINV